MAYQKKGSKASLLASAGIAAALLLGAALMTGRTRVAGTLLALGARPRDPRLRSCVSLRVESKRGCRQLQHSQATAALSAMLLFVVVRDVFGDFGVQPVARPARCSHVGSDPKTYGLWPAFHCGGLQALQCLSMHWLVRNKHA